MNAPLVLSGNALPPAPPEAIEAIRAIEAKVKEREDIHPQMEHVLHAGMYARTCRLGPGTLIVGVLIKLPTMLIVNGGAFVFAGTQWHKIEGLHNVRA